MAERTYTNGQAATGRARSGCACCAETERRAGMVLRAGADLIRSLREALFLWEKYYEQARALPVETGPEEVAGVRTLRTRAHRRTVKALM